LGLDDLVSTESAVVATATAAIFSPRTRETLRRGAVLGVAGAMKAGDVVVAGARGVVRGVRGDGDGSSQRSGTGGSTARASSSRSGTSRGASSRSTSRPRTRERG
jgi:hypothetical protein